MSAVALADRYHRHKRNNRYWNGSQLQAIDHNHSSQSVLPSESSLVGTVRQGDGMRLIGLLVVCTWLGSCSPTSAQDQAVTNPQDIISQSLGNFETGCPTPFSRWHGSIEFLWWWIRQDDVPSLVTTGPEGTLGRLGDPGVSVLYGGNISSRHDRFIGLRPTLGYWLDDCREWGIEASAFILERDSSLFQIEEVTTPLFRPFVNAVTGQPDAEQFAGTFPNNVVRRGSINIYGRKELFGEDIRLLKQLDETGPWRWYGVAGFKFLQFRNRFNIINTGYDEPELNVLYGVEDNFFAYDRFYGGQLGVRVEGQTGPWSLQSTLSCGLGGNEQRIVIYGNRLVQTPLVRDFRAGGLYAMPTNATDDARWTFNAIPEFTLNLGWSPFSWMRLQVGYTLLLWFNTVRAGDQIDTVVNTDQYDGQLDGPARPSVPWKERMLWVQGVSVALEINW